MNIRSAKLIYFSPTRTSRKVIEGIAHGVNIDIVAHVDLTLPETAKRNITEIHADLAIIGFPVYSGRLPLDAISRFRRLRGNNTPAVIVVVYGNRAYEDALVELRELAVEMGFTPIAAGAFIGEHSYSNKTTPIADGRPDVEDLRIATEFGMLVSEKLRNIHVPENWPQLHVPGNVPYKDRGMLSNISPVTEASACIKCEECVLVCPTAAITVKDTVVTDRSACIRCCACIKSCSRGARTMEDLRIRQISEQLSMNCIKRNEPETFL